MGEQSKQVTREIKQLVQVILKDQSADARKAALLGIRHYDAPRIIELLEHVSRKDSNWQVRDLAKNLLRKKQAQTGLQSLSTSPEIAATTPPVNAAESVHSSTDASWRCTFCDLDNHATDQCVNCGADRPSTAGSTRKIKPGELFLLDERNRGFIVGKRKTIATDAHGCLFLFFLPFILTGIFVVLLGVTSLRDWYTLNSRGLTVDGTYTERSIHTDLEDDRVSYKVGYQFTLHSDFYTNSQNVNQEFYNRVEEGAPVSILYDPYNPNLSVITGQNDVGLALGTIGFAFCWNLFIWPIIISLWVSRQRDARLAREGQLLKGHVLNSSSSYDSDNDLEVEIEFAFQSPTTGQTITHKSSKIRSDLKGKSLPRSDHPVAVLYRTEKHFKLL